MIQTNFIIRPSLIAALLATAVAAVGTGCGGAATSHNANSPVEMYRKADSARNSGAYSKAIGWYEALEVRFPFSEFTRQAQLDLIYSYYKAGQPDAAIDAADKFIRENPRHENVDYAYYLKGLVHFERDRNLLERMFKVDLAKRPPSDATQAFSSFSLLTRRFPDSKYADDAAQRMIFLRNRLADYEKYVADYYLRLKAYVAALNRAKYIIENYPEAPAVADALRIQIAAYAELGLDDLAESAQRVYNYNYGNQRLPATAEAAAETEPPLAESADRKSLKMSPQLSTAVQPNNPK